MSSHKRVLADKGRRQRRERRDSFAAGVPKSEKRSVGRSTTRETPLHMRAPGLELDSSLREYVRARTGFKLGKFALHVTRITVRLEDISGPKGAPVVACRFKVVLAGMREVVVTATGSAPREAFDTTADAIERAVRRLLGRTRGKRVGRSR